MNDAILVAIRHNSWANQRLIEFCRGLSEEQLAWTVPGTLGSIHETLYHTVGSQFGYLMALTGEPLPFTPTRAGEPPLPLDELVRLERMALERCERLLAEPFDIARMTSRPNRPKAAAGIVLAQYVHHGSDHRAHVGTILGAHGVQPPDIDVWAYGLERGDVTPASPS